VCAQNAQRLGISNVSFTHVAPGTPLPFEDNSFDGVMAASSVEQTPDPRFTLQEIFRVLRPGGRLRINYEALNRYRDGWQRDTWLLGIDDHHCRLILFDRHIDEERVVQVGVTFAMSRQELLRSLSVDGHSLPFDAITAERLEQVRSFILDARVCTTIHPSGRTLMAWLLEIGFREVRPTHNGIQFAGQLFDELPGPGRPDSLAAIDAYLRPIISVVVALPAPIEDDPMITAVK
jgi:SAM-dependent methyltransferase